VDFVVGLPLTQRKNNAIWIAVDRLTKMAHFIGMRHAWTLDRLARAYLEEIVRLHGVLPIVSDRGTRFQSGFWKKLQEAFKTLLHFSTAFHPPDKRTNEMDNPYTGRHAESVRSGLQGSLG